MTGTTNTLETLRSHLASDEAIRERAAVWRDLSPEACLAATGEECEVAIWMLEHLDPVTRERALDREPLPSDTIELLERIARR